MSKNDPRPEVLKEAMRKVFDSSRAYLRSKDDRPEDSAAILSPLEAHQIILAWEQMAYLAAHKVQNKAEKLAELSLLITTMSALDLIRGIAAGPARSVSDTKKLLRKIADIAKETLKLSFDE